MCLSNAERPDERPAVLQHHAEPVVDQQQHLARLAGDADIASFPHNTHTP